jgi:hypothetical protein
MAFMIPIADYFTAYRVSTNCGDELVPEDLVGAIDLDAEPTSEEWESLLQYCEGNRIEGVAREEGWYARLSAPGYLDCTSWDGPHATEQEALDAVKAEYDVDDDGNDLDDESVQP